MKKAVILLLCLMFLISGVVACSNSVVTQKQEESGEKEDHNKYNAYIDLSNHVINGGYFESVVSVYFKEFGVDKEVYIEDDFEEFSSAPFIPGVIGSMNDILKYASLEPSYGVIDEKVQQLVPVIVDLMNTINEIQIYYSEDKYLSDDFKQGKELHIRAVGLFEQYIEASEQYMIELPQITTERKYQDAEMLKEEGLLIRYYAMCIVLRSQEIQDAFSMAGISDENILDFDLKQYEDLYTPLIEDIAHYNEYAADEARRKSELWANLHDFGGGAENVKVTADDILQILREQNSEINSDLKGKVTTGGNNAILSTFDRKVSSLIDGYNINISVKVTN